MASALVYSIALIPQQFNDDSLLQRYGEKCRELRLRSLKSDPDSFSSSFTKESQQPFEFWTGRLLNSKALHYVVIQHNLDSKVEEALQNAETILQSKWVGILVRLGPRIVDIDSFSNESSWKTLLEGGSKKSMDRADTNNSRAAAYHLAGFYIAPETRGQGLGARLVQTALDNIAADCQIADSSRAICTVGTDRRNAVPQRLFAKMGFSNVAIDNIQTDDGRHLTEIIWRQDFSVST